LPAAPAAADQRGCQGVAPVYDTCPATGTIGSTTLTLSPGCLMSNGHLTITVTTATFSWTVGVHCDVSGNPYYDGNTSSGSVTVGQTYTLNVVATGTGYFEASLSS
jgi:hypothetical protein